MRICIIGLGQIGGSLALSLRKKGNYIYGISRRKETIEYAVQNGIIDDGDTKIKKTDFDVIFLAVHLGLYEDYMKKLKGFSGILSDVGSVKRIFFSIAKRGGFRFAGSHPIAGTEKSGITSADEKLFDGKFCIVSGWSDTQAKNEICDIWKSVGAKVVFMSPQKHDEFVCAISHLPHVIAFSLVNSTYKIRKRFPNIFGGSFKDITRVVQSPEEMWTDILVYNSDLVLKYAENYLTEIKKFLGMIRTKQKHKILKYIISAKKRL